MSQLAIHGGTKVREKPFPAWPLWTEEDAQAVADVVRSSAWGIPRGSKVNEFEQAFAEFQGARFGVCTPSGTSALEIALRACGVGFGDEVITSPYTFIATASSIFHIGAVPVFVDVDAETSNIDPGQIGNALTPYTKAIMPVHVAGCPADMDSIISIARRHNLCVIEDACQAHGARWREKGVGSIGDCGAFSFQSSKNLNCGEGGIGLMEEETLYERAYAFHYVGNKKDGTPPKPLVLGTNNRMTEFQAALLLSQMRHLPDQMRRRQANVAYLTGQLLQMGLDVQKRDPRVTSHAYHLFVIRYHPEGFDGVDRDRFIQALRAEGIPCGPGYRPLYREPVWQSDAHVQSVLRSHPRKIDFAQIHLPTCERICKEEAIWLTQNVLLGDREDMNSIVEAVAKVQALASTLA